MRIGWSCKEIAAILNVSPTKAGQSLDPAMHKIAKLYRVDPIRTTQAILTAIEELEAMSEEELAAREAMLNGRMDRRLIHPRGT